MMQPILVPKPSPDAFNKNRRVSDLLHSQIRHFQHLDQKLGLGIDQALARDVDTEAGAARYIAAVTRAVRGAGIASGPVLVQTRSTPQPQQVTGAPISETVPTLAAAADPRTPAVSAPELAGDESEKEP